MRAGRSDAYGKRDWIDPESTPRAGERGTRHCRSVEEYAIALHVDPKFLADTDPFIRRELQWLCLTCSNKKRCEHELAKGTATNHFPEFCPNAVSIDELLE